MTTTTLRLHHLMPLLPLLLLLLLAAAAAGSGTGPPSFWAMDPRLMSPPPAERAGPTARDQFTTEGLVWERYQQRAAAAAARGNGSDGSSSSGGSGGQPPFPLQTARHVRLLKGVLEGFPERIPQAYAASVPWCCYWCCHALDVLGAAAKAIGPALRRKIQATLKRCQQPDGGFAGLLDADASASTSTDPSSPYSPSHVLSTYAALATLAILHHHTNTTQPPSPSPLSLPFPSRQRLRGFLLSLKHPTDGTFRATPAQDAEVDARSIYGALAVARLGGWLDDPAVVEKEKLIQYLVGLQTHEGGFAGESGDVEAHAAFSFCALASLALLGAVDRVRDPGGLARWAARRQRAFEGGCDGRTNKLVDACYAFWAGALPPLLSLSSSGQQDKTPPPPQPRLLLHGGALARYLLAVAQDVDVEQGGGGFADKPGAAVDYYHTCYALSGLSVAVHDLGFDLGLDGGGGSAAAAALLVDGLRARVRRVDVRLNVCVEALRAWDAACPLPD